tara:strand:- start:36 stop:230 length:195 start_codon:yes stop_codon:yes gene_type:complete
MSLKVTARRAYENADGQKTTGVPEEMDIQMPNQAPAAAADVAALKVQFDALLTKLVDAGLMAAE